jgi:tripartite-type tricarboxylate transporter receptor subunit TctC
MPRINHIALKVPDLAQASALYEGVFGLRHVSTVKNSGRTSRHLTDGYPFLTMIQYDSEDTPEAGFAGAGPCIHHFGIVVDDPAAYEAKLARGGLRGAVGQLGGAACDVPAEPGRGRRAARRRLDPGRREGGRAMSRRAILAAGAGAMAAATLGTVSRASAQERFPTRPARVVLGFAPGGGADIYLRSVALRLNQIWCQPVVVENRPGASGFIGADIVAKAPPDGYTLSLSVPNSLGPHVMKAPYDALRDCTPITLGVQFPMICVVGSAVPVSTFPELVAYARANVGKLTFASTGNGSIQQIGGEVFNRITGAQITHVPYKGSAPAILDVIAGNVTMSFDTSTGATQHIKAGKLKALAVLASQRLTGLPEVPTTAEVGQPGFELSAWYGCHGPAGMPRALVEQIQQDIARAMAFPDVREKLLGMGEVVKRTGIRAD